MKSILDPIVRFNYAIKPLRYLLLTEALLLYLVFYVPQGREILHISLEQFEYIQRTTFSMVMMLLFILGSVWLMVVLCGALFYRTLWLYRNYKHFDQSFPLRSVRRIEQATIYVSMIFPLLFYLIFWWNEPVKNTWPVAIIQIITISLLILLMLRDDSLIKLSDLESDPVTFWSRVSKRPFHSLALLFWAIPLFLLLNPDAISFIQGIGALGLIMLAAYMFFHLVYLLHWSRIRWEVPSFFIAIAWLIFCSYLNGNHAVRTLPGNETPSSRPVLSAALDQWLAERHRVARDSFSVYIVAAEGGGSRAAYWTHGVLLELEERIPAFDEHLLAISSVSGGTVGAGFYISQKLSGDLRHGVHGDSAILEATGSDLLSPLLSGFLFSDLLQQFLPFPVPFWDRSRRLEYGMIHSFEKIVGDDTLNPMAAPSLQDALKVPWHFMNSTVVETGGKGIWAPVRTDADYFPGNTDLVEWLGRDVRRATALVNSARFPVVTPGGEFRDKTGKTLGHVVDGGYFENTGIETAYSLMRALLDLRDRYPVKPVFIYIQNSRSDARSEPASSTLTASNPIRVFYQAWSSRSPSNHALINGLEKPLEFDSWHIPLIHQFDGEDYTFPLAWVLSRKSKDALSAQLDTLWKRPEAKDWRTMGTR